MVMHIAQMNYGNILGDVTNDGKSSDKFDQGRGKWRVDICDNQIGMKREKRRCEHGHMQ
jgi:hypothetical protein